MQSEDVKEDAKSKSKKYEDYELEGWVDTLQRAEEIKADPDKMKALGPLIRKKMRAFKSIEDLEKHHQEMNED